MLGYAAEAAKQQPLTRAQIVAHVYERFPDAPIFNLDSLGADRKARGLAYRSSGSDSLLKQQMSCVFDALSTCKTK